MIETPAKLAVDRKMEERPVSQSSMKRISQISFGLSGRLAPSFFPPFHAGPCSTRNWDAISDRNGETVPDYGFTQAERETASAASNDNAPFASASR